MSTQGFALLLSSVMTASGVECLDARNPRPAHAAFHRLAEANDRGSRDLLQHFGVELSTSPDPDMRHRVAGLTRAIWQAVADGYLLPHEDDTTGWFTVAAFQRRALLDLADALPEHQRSALYRVGADWASCSTSRKKEATSALVAGKTRLSFA